MEKLLSDQGFSLFHEMCPDDEIIHYKGKYQWEPVFIEALNPNHRSNSLVIGLIKKIRKIIFHLQFNSEIVDFNKDITDKTQIFINIEYIHSRIDKVFQMKNCIKINKITTQNVFDVADIEFLWINDPEIKTLLSKCDKCNSRKQKCDVCCFG